MSRHDEARRPVKLDRRAWMEAGMATINYTFAMDNNLRCAGVAFFGFLSVFPALSAAISLFGLIADPTQIAVADPPFAAALPDDVTIVIKEQIAEFAARDATAGWGLAISLLVALWTGSRGMNALVFAITRAHRETEERSFIASIVMSLAATVGAFVTLGIIIASLTVVPALAVMWPYVDSRETALLWLRWPLVVLVLTVAVFFLYRHAPNRRSPRRDWVVPGAILATLLWLLGSVALSFFIENFGRYNATFGSIAAAAIFMLWLYFSALVLIAGAALNAELEWRTTKDTTVGPDRPMGERQAHVADTLAPQARERNRDDDVHPVQDAERRMTT
ncbi:MULTISPECIES: YihY/virulence factor BrkB family protein [unclassified Roseitalea]|uniref:YihY/virulence factor BrkB family protein n=1 Tax=unclassified Roseitalea TaxID=2639107 RepID=UPI00273EBC5F|nr:MULTISPECIES: YihY/virulence factor BrkB family protein [unclassified Roseitalea]